MRPVRPNGLPRAGARIAATCRILFAKDQTVLYSIRRRMRTEFLGHPPGWSDHYGHAFCAALQPVVVVTLPAGCASVNGGCVSRHRLVIQVDIASAAYWAPRSALLMRNATSNRRRQWGWRVFAKGLLSQASSCPACAADALRVVAAMSSAAPTKPSLLRSPHIAAI
jgi:hypothetical protein